MGADHLMSSIVATGAVIIAVYMAVNAIGAVVALVLAWRRRPR